MVDSFSPLQSLAAVATELNTQLYSTTPSLSVGSVGSSSSLAASAQVKDNSCAAVLKNEEVRLMKSLSLKRRNGWTFSEEVLLVGTVCEEFLVHGSLASPRLGVKPESNSSDTESDSVCWRNIATEYETARQQLSLFAENEEELKPRCVKMLNRHFKVLKKKHRFCPEERFSTNKVQSETTAEKYDNIGLKPFFTVWLKTFGNNTHLGNITQQDASTKETTVKINLPHKRKLNSFVSGDNRTNTWSFFEEVALIGAIMLRFLSFGSLVKKKSNSWDEIKFIFDTITRKLFSFHDKGKLNTNSFSKVETLAKEMYGTEVKLNEDLILLINRQLVLLNIDANFTQRTSTALQRHYKVMRTNRDLNTAVGLKALYLVFCQLPFFLDKSKPCEQQSLFNEVDFTKLVSTFYSKRLDSISNHESYSSSSSISEDSSEVNLKEEEKVLVENEETATTEQKTINNQTQQSGAHFVSGIEANNANRLPINPNFLIQKVLLDTRIEMLRWQLQQQQQLSFLAQHNLLVNPLAFNLNLLFSQTFLNFNKQGDLQTEKSKDSEKERDTVQTDSMKKSCP